MNNDLSHLALPFDERYDRQGFYWGVEPSRMAVRSAEIVLSSTERAKDHYRALELGCGNGRDAIYMAKQGFEVVAVDYSRKGLTKAFELAQLSHVDVEFVLANFNSPEFSVEGIFDVVLCLGAAHYIKEARRRSLIEYVQQITRVGGVHSVSGFYENPLVLINPDRTGQEEPLRQGELQRLYEGWELEFSQEKVEDIPLGGQSGGKRKSGRLIGMSKIIACKR